MAETPDASTDQNVEEHIRDDLNEAMRARAVVSRLVEEQGKDFRKVMPLASRETKGRADGRRVQEIVRELTA